MFAPCLLVFTFVASSRSQSVFALLPQDVQEQWTDLDDSAQFYDAYGPPMGADLWPENPAGVTKEVTVATRSPANSTEPAHMRTPESDAVGASAVWKAALVVAVLLVSVAGSMSMAYYLCFWRGGRFYYQPQKEGDP